MQNEANYKLPGVKPVVILAALVLGLTLIGGVSLYFSASQFLRAQARAQAAEAPLEGVSEAHLATPPPYTQHGAPAPAKAAPTTKKSSGNVPNPMQDWALSLVVVTTAGSAAAFLSVLLGVVRWRNRVSKQLSLSSQGQGGHIQPLQQTPTELQRASLELERQRTQSRHLQEELRNLQAELERRVEERTSNLTKMYTQMEGELNDRKQMERALAQQAQELGRSKDVLEMHVQARTQELQKLQRRYEHILNSAGEGIYGLDLQGHTTFVNPAAARLTGWKVEELVGRLEQEVFLGNKSAKPQTTILSRQGDYPSEAVFYRKDGSSFLIESVRTPIMEKEKLVGAVVVFKDITDRKRTEEALARKAAELARSNAELEQFAYVASHDLQEPLRKIQAFGDRLKTKVDSANLQEGRDYLERMQNAAARMQRLINDLLTFSRVITATQPFVPVDLGALTREVLTDLEVRIEQTKAKIEVGPLPTIEADPMQMRQLFQNLIGNALKFQAPGAHPLVKIEAQILHSPLATESDPRLEEQTCEITVKDNGIGFEEKYSEKIFAMFQRLHGRNAYEGTGVGLAVCRRITDRHGGTIQAKSQPGKGASFIIRVPVRHPVKPEASKAEETK